jgi:predicted small secreted protein
MTAGMGFPQARTGIAEHANPIWGRASACSLSVTASETQIIGNAMFKRTTLLTLTLITLLAAAPLLGACNTTAGAGKDISKVGDKIEEEAVEHTP